MKKIFVLVAALTATATQVSAQFDPEAHRPAANQLIQAALRDSFGYKRLAQLTDGFGHRLSGSESLERAIDWIVAEMKRDGFDNVRKEPVMVPKWVRGAESAELISPRRKKLAMLGLGRSIGTPAAGITAQVLVVKNFAELRARAAEARGKIVLWNVPYVSYGRTVVYRAVGADSASAVGAVASLVRSITPVSLQTPHTGAMAPYDSTGRIRPIPAAAVTIEDAELMQRMQDRGEKIEVKLVMSARMMGMSQSHNVVAEIRGSERPDEVIVMGGHIDSWDVGTGAMDDAGGCVAAWEALRLIKATGVRPKRTIRVVMWTNEENGLMGATGYRDAHRANVDQHVLAMESDNGVFKPSGLRYGTGPGGEAIVRGIASLLRPIDADSIAVGGPQADIGPLFALGVPVITFDTDQEKYFWYHHTEADMIDKLDPVDMAKNTAMFAVVANTVANMQGTLPRVQPARPAVP
jgi:carboxypeptidase Q